MDGSYTKVHHKDDLYMECTSHNLLDMTIYRHFTPSWEIGLMPIAYPMQLNHSLYQLLA